MITEGWSGFYHVLQTFGAIVAVRYGISMINTYVIPEELVPFVLKHEVIENTFDADTTEAAGKIIQQLGLKTPVIFGKIRPNHVIATVRQLRLAQKDGKLDAMMSFADDLEAMPENKSHAVGNKELRMKVYELLTCTPWQQ